MDWDETWRGWRRRRESRAEEERRRRAEGEEDRRRMAFCDRLIGKWVWRGVRLCGKKSEWGFVASEVRLCVCS